VHIEKLELNDTVRVVGTLRLIMCAGSFNKVNFNSIILSGSCYTNYLLPSLYFNW